MARINIEDGLFKRNAWFKLIVATGNADSALGTLVRAWIVAQRFWFPDRKPIPKAVWDEEELHRAVIDVGLAEEREDGIYVCGAEEQFTWLFQKQDAGKKGGAKSGAKRALAAVKRTKAAAKLPPSAANPLTLSLSLSPSSFSNSPSFTENSEKSEIEIPKQASEGGGVREFIAIYCELWKDRYKTNPEMGGKPAGIAGRLVKNLGLRRATELVHAYLEMNDTWFVNQRHDLPTLEAKLQAVVIFADTGKTVTQGELRQADRAQTNRNVWDSLKTPEGGSHAK